MTKDLREMSYDQLIEYSAQVFKEVRRRAYGEGYRQGKFDAEVTNEQTKETSQQARDRIVAQAKKDVEELKDSRFGLYIVGPFVCKAEFIVNKDKRTVVALLRGIHSGRVRGKGIAKCAPGDCFNVWIGKAIALRRALGLEVPSEYLNAPQPSEVRVGVVIRFTSPGEWYGKVETISGFNHKGRPLTHETPGFIDEENYVIIDDSREEV